MKTRLEEHYLTAVRPTLIEKFGYGNVFEVPRLEKVVINMGVGNAVRDSKKIEYAVNDMTDSHLWPETGSHAGKKG